MKLGISIKLQVDRLGSRSEELSYRRSYEGHLEENYSMIYSTLKTNYLLDNSSKDVEHSDLFKRDSGVDLGQHHFFSDLLFQY
jgi:hypothetical protein